MKYPRSPHEKVGGIFYFGRMLDKIRLKAGGELHPDLHQNLGIGFDKRCADFLRISYEDLAKRVAEGLGDAEALEWCFSAGRKPSDEESISGTNLCGKGAGTTRQRRLFNGERNRAASGIGMT